MIDTPEKIAEARAVIESLSDSERRRLAQFFSDVLQASAPISEHDWSDKTPDGVRQAPEPTMVATNSK